MKLGYLGIDQYGQRYKIDKYPRKKLMEQLGHASANRMFNGRKHVGYVIGGFWITVYEVHDWIGGTS